MVIARVYFFFSSRRRHTRLQGDWSSDVCSSDLAQRLELIADGLGDLRAVAGRKRRRDRGAQRHEQRLARGSQLIERRLESLEIGRASCRERVERWGGAGACKEEGERGSSG